MKGLVVFFCILVHVCQAEAYDYLKLAVVWSPSYCTTVGTNCIHQPVPRWTMNGYWPMLKPDKRV